MRLNSDFHDYYDHALGYGIDDGIYYERFTKEVEIRINTTLSWPEYGLPVGIVGFCGRIYPFAEVRRHERVEHVNQSTIEYRLIETYFAFHPDEYAAKAKAWKDRGGFNVTNHLRWRALKQFFLDWSFESDDVFREHGVPVWLLPNVRDYRRGLLNPRLKDYGFEKLKAPVTAFQEISVYLANSIATRETPVTVEDKFKIEQHGFDLKRSFRKDRQS